MALNQVQRNFINNQVRPTVERLIFFKSQMDAFVADYDNQQTPLPTTAAALDDNTEGTAPRADVPQITGAQAQNLRTFCANMSGQINAAALNALIAVAIRDLESILRDQR